MSNTIPAIEAVREQLTLDVLLRAGAEGIDLAAVARSLAQASDRGEPAAREILEALRALERAGEAVEWNRRWFAIRHTDWIVGWVSLLSEGGAVLRSGPAGEISHEVPVRSLKAARDGDFVLAKEVRERRPRGAQLPAAAVVKVLVERRSRVVGRIVRRDDGSLGFEPFDTRFLSDVVLNPTTADEGSYVVVDLLPGRVGEVVRGEVAEILGSLETQGVDLEVVRRHHEIPEAFAPDALAEAARLPSEPPPAAFAGRADLRGRCVVTIDGAGSRDFDDALSLEARTDGSWLLGVHIADVSHYVPEGSALDREAYVRGTSVYFPERALPMLPEDLSNGLCSLRPGVERLTLSAFLEFAASGELISSRFTESVIRSRCRLTYDGVSRRLAGDSGAEELPADVMQLLRDLERLMRRLLELRMARGSIDFDLPEGDVRLDEKGATIDVLASERTVAHRIVEECMIAANQAVAAELVANDCAALHRVHSPPDPRRLEELRLTLATLGLAVPSDLESLDPASLQRIQAAVVGRPEEAFVSSLLLRSLQRARYDPEPLGHYALAARHYTHFTSPIRRYPDLVVHRRLKALLRGVAAEEARRTFLTQRLGRLAERCSTTERRAETAERMLLQWKKARFLAPRVGEVFSGRVSNVAPFGLFVQLDGLFVDGLAPIRSMTDDFYEFQPVERALVGAERGRRFRLGDGVRVVLDGFDERRRGLIFRLEGMVPAAPRSARPKPRAAKGRRR